jgi:hypothetical protein
MSKDSELFSMQDKSNQRPVDLEYYGALNEFWSTSIGSNLDKLRAFTKYVPLGEMAKLFVKYELFKKILNIHGAIIECGVHQGGGVLTWGMLSSIFEPVNHLRKIVGFDTFEGFADISEKDLVNAGSHTKIGGLSVNAYDDILQAIKIFDMFRPLGHINKIELVKGDATKTIEDYIKENPHLVVAMLYLDFDVYTPTKRAIELFRERMPKGSMIVFDELYVKNWPGETQALQDTIGISNLKIERFHFYPQISYAVL